MRAERSALRVAVDARPLLAQRTGVESYLGQLVEQLSARPDLRLELLSDRPGLEALESERLRVRCVPTRSRLPRALGDTWMLRDLPRSLAGRPCDVFFTASAKFPPGLTPSVVTVHDLGWRHMPAAYTASERVRQHLWTSWAARRATRLIAVSQFTRSDLVAWHPRCAARVRVVYEAPVPLHVDSSAPGEGTLPPGLREPFALTVGTLSPKKNLETLFQAFSQLRAQGFPELQLAVVGRRGWKAEPIVRAARATPGVVLLGYVDDAALRSLYSRTALCVCPCPCEGFGLPALEAMARGTPTLVVNTGSLPEVTGDGALHCAPDAAGFRTGLETLLHDASLRAELVERGAKRLEQFSWARAADAVAGVLREAADER